jgi:hypothetical protein
MKLFLTLLLTAALGHSLLQGSDLAIVQSGKSDYVIAFPEKASLNLMREYRNAAKLLRTLIQKRTGVTLPEICEKDVKAHHKVIYIGNTAAAGKRKIQKKWALNEYRIKADKGDIFLVGDDNDSSPGNVPDITPCAWAL